jgi:sugar phosphate isomerase/epimerase
MGLRHAICNEIYQGWEFAAACRHARATGYEGLEIAPLTLSEQPASLPAAARAGYRRAMDSAGLAYVGLHWIMMAPKGLHVTTPDAALRERSWAHIARLVELSAELAGGAPSLMVFGSPQQRGTTGGATRAEATARLAEGLAGVAAHAAAHQVTILIEALPLNQCDVVNSLAEAVAMVEQIASPAIATMFDTHNAVDETEPHAALLERYWRHIRHIHVNETDGRHCGQGDYDFAPLLATLQRLHYGGWVSLEAFDFTPGAERMARESIDHLQGILAKLG